MLIDCMKVWKAQQLFAHYRAFFAETPLHTLKRDVASATSPIWWKRLAIHVNIFFFSEGFHGADLSRIWKHDGSRRKNGDGGTRIRLGYSLHIIFFSLKLPLAVEPLRNNNSFQKTDQIEAKKRRETDNRQ